MKDYRMDYIREIETALAQVFDPEQIPIISNIVIKALDGYEITERCTEIEVQDDINERLIKRYAACMSIDGKSKGTIKLYLATIKKLSDVLRKPFPEMGAYDIRYFLALEKDRGISNRTLENTRAFISAFFQWMLNDDIIPKNPLNSIKPIKYPDVIRKPFSDIELDAIRGACNTVKKRTVIELLISTGLRVSELTNLRIEDINTIDLSVKVRQGKGGKDRITYMTTVCMKYIQKYLSKRTDNEPWLILNNRGEKYSVDGIQWMLTELGKAAMVEDVHPHRFRRTFATGLARRGMEVQEVQKLLGHRDISTTMIYVSVDDTSIKSSYQKYSA